MEVLLWLIPVALGLGGLGLAAFLWALKSGQFDDLDGAAHRILFDDEDTAPLPKDPPEDLRGIDRRIDQTIDRDTDVRG